MIRHFDAVNACHIFTGLHFWDTLFLLHRRTWQWLLLRCTTSEAEIFLGIWLTAIIELYGRFTIFRLVANSLTESENELSTGDANVSMFLMQHPCIDSPYVRNVVKKTSATGRFYRLSCHLIQNIHATFGCIVKLDCFWSLLFCWHSKVENRFVALTPVFCYRDVTDSIVFVK